MAKEKEAKQKPGRKRKHPEGSVEHRIYLSPELHERMEKYRLQLEVIPDDGAVLVTALDQYLKAKGF